MVTASAHANIKLTSKVSESFSNSKPATISSVPPTVPSAPPSFNVVGASETNQLAQSIGQDEKQPVKAYVVSNDVRVPLTVRFPATVRSLATLTSLGKEIVTVAVSEPEPETEI